MLSLRPRSSKRCLYSAHLKTVRLALVLCLSLPTLLLAQGTGGRILGRIADPTGAVLSGVKVTATNDATGVSQNTVSNDSGDYVLPNLPVGTYSLSFDLTGFKNIVRHTISLDVNQVITLNMTMQVGRAQEVVDVTSEAPLVDTSSTQLGAVVNNRSVNELPLNARDTYQFLQLQPGVQSQLGSSGGTFYGSSDAGAVSVNGGRGRANNFSVNGGDANDSVRQSADHPADARRHRRISRHQQYLRRRIRPQLRRGGERCHQVGHQPVARQRLRVLPQHGFECARILQHDQAAGKSEPVRRNLRRPAQEGPDFLFHFV